MSDDELVTCGIYDLESLQKAWRNGKHFKFVYFWSFEKEDALLDQYNETCLSQWFPSEFKDDDGNQYCCCEQYMMAQKAILFKDDSTLQKILASKSPQEIKGLGREVENFKQDIWDQKCQDIVYHGNLYKFSQNEKFYDYIMSVPQDTIFVEASPLDDIWGIKFAANKPQAKDPLKWKGKNYLGFQLTKVRDCLFSQLSSE